MYTNKSVYEVKVGDKVEVYYSTNSCCYYCVSTKNNWNHIIKTGGRTIDSGASGCEGCNYIASYVFKAQSLGSDTVFLNHVLGGDSCEVVNEQEKYIINVVE